MADTEIDGFIQKFKKLRAAGIAATLNFETNLGEVSISLTCKVGRNIPPPSHLLPPVAASKMRSPSYYRRQVRRKAEREVRRKSTTENSSLTVADQAEEIVEAAVNSDNKLGLS